MEKLKMHSPDLVVGNIDKIAALFPNCITEAKDADGKITRAVDFDLLKQELSGSVVEGPQERYRLDWPGKREALLAANSPIAKTLRPCRKESVDFDTTRNLFIEGDNLDALKILQETYLGRIKMIYIDPPYNTGKDFLYKDNFDKSGPDYLVDGGMVSPAGLRLTANPETNGRFHSDWLSMLYPRLKLARNLLCENGIIFISIDDSEACNLKKICDEIFGSENFLTQIVWKNRYNAAKEIHLAQIHEYILMYARDINKIDPIYLPTTEEYVQRYFKLKDDKFETRGPYRLQPLEAGRSMDERSNLRYSIPTPDGGSQSPKRQWKWGRDRAMAALSKGELEFTKVSDGWSISTKQYLRDEANEEYGIKGFSIIDGIYTQSGTKELDAIFGSVTMFPYPKPTKLVSHLLNIAKVESNEIVLDFFAGAGTTAHGLIAHNLNDGKNRRFILIQLPEPCAADSEAFAAGFKTIADLSKARIHRYVDTVKLSENTTSDFGFRVLKVDADSFAATAKTPDLLAQGDLAFDLENLRKDRSPEDLLFQVMLDWGVDLGLPICSEMISGKKVFFVDGNALAACFDTEISEELVTALAKRRLHDLPLLKVVFRDAGYASDSAKINVEQIFKLLSPTTELRTL